MKNGNGKKGKSAISIDENGNCHPGGWGIAHVLSMAEDCSAPRVDQMRMGSATEGKDDDTGNSRTAAYGQVVRTNV